MANSSFKLALQIGASIGQSFRTSVRGSQSQLNQLGSSINKLKNQQASIKKVELGEASVGKARVAYEAASRELSRLRREVASTDQPSKQLTQSFEAAKRKTERLSQALGKQRDRLQQSRRELQQAGVSSRNLMGDNARLGASVERLSQKYRKLNQAMRAQEANKAQRADLRGQLFDAVALGATVVAPVSIAVNFEQSIARLGAITRSGDDALLGLEKTARRLGETTQFSASEAASAMTFLGMAGFKTNEIISATPGMLNLAQAAGSDLAGTADIASNILSGFSLKADEMGRVGDVLSATFTTSNTTLQMLGDTLKYAAPVASSAGASIEQVAAMAGLLGNVGIQGSMAGTALRAAFLRLSAPPKVAADALANLGVEVKDLDGNLRSVPELLQELAQATEGLGSAERAEAIKQIFGSEASAGLTELLKQAGSGALDSYIQQLQQAKGTADTMAKKMSATTAGSLKRLGSALESVAISIGSLLLPTIAAGAQLFAGMASWVSGAAQEYPWLTKVIVGATVGLVALKVTAIAGTYAFTFLKGGVLSLVTAYRTLSAGIAMAQLGMARMNVLSALSAVRMGVVTAAQWALNVAMTANPIGLIVVGIAALAGAAFMLIKYWEPIGEFFSGLWDGVKNITSGAVDWLLGKMNLLAKPFELLGSAWNAVSGWLDGDESEDAPSSANKRKLATAAVGASLAAQPAMALPNSTVNALPQIQAVSAANHNQQSVIIDAPITIHAAPGMDERAIAGEVQKALEQREARAASQQRGALYDV
ncbi:phage tail tape measure protein [Microbulbifer sp. OS29]|uniref:Phage tail tape measure protein n=1 Tax=Microbulbifer okhotskensis TaxID=2926617 RepID=A0A9X2EJ20_9GAMM|nr:phage tail tape measure protein [Microbulbifer okhotskensis]MCO1333142.1 phage tail tape measure protein [Microbulbifer okhotskensis]